MPVLVTGIQSTRVRVAGESFQPKDLGLLDPCDKHRDESWEGQAVKQTASGHHQPGYSGR
ncbi:hypothetical protein BS628_03835 [Agrobacterium radiobacter]|nr:hypothetical protein BS628_03835 [Agrobacterium radiobacter]